MTPEEFVRLLKGYFGPWRGPDVEERLLRWIRSKKVLPWELKDLYFSLTETRKIQPVNTIGVSDVDEELERYYETSRSTVPRIEAPAEGYVPREEAARRVRQLLEMITDDTRRKEILTKVVLH